MSAHSLRESASPRAGPSDGESPQGFRPLAGSNPRERPRDKKRPPLPGVATIHGGGGGIRTLVTRKGPNGFRDRRIQPLCHPSEG